MDISLFDSKAAINELLPLTYTRPISEIRVGIFTIREKWGNLLGESISYKTSDYLQDKFRNKFEKGLIVNGGLCPNEKLIEQIKALDPSQTLVKGEVFLAKKSSEPLLQESDLLQNTEFIEVEGNFSLVQYPWDVFRLNASEIKADLSYIRNNRITEELKDSHTICYGDDIFIEKGASIKASILNSEKGPIYIGKNAKIHEGAIINGAFALCEGSHVNPGAKIKGDSTVGPYSKVGGEFSNSVIFGYSNKGHDGFVGNSVIGEWCNIGADTNTSNLKNNYANVKLWNYNKLGFKDTGLQFCGLIMGDHAKCGINTMFNTGTITGVGANVFGAGFPRNYIPEFAWGGASGFSTFKLPKFYETAEKVMERRGIELTDQDKEILKSVYHISEGARYWEKQKKA